jgi:hypothetical protein
VMVISKLLSVNRIHQSYGSYQIDDDLDSIVIYIINERPSLRIFVDHIDKMVVELYESW